jgi:hypothetical protein
MWLSESQSRSGFLKNNPCPFPETEPPSHPFGSLDIRPTTFKKYLNLKRAINSNLGVGLTTPPRLKNIVTKSEEVNSPSTETNGHKFLRRPGPTRGCRANDDELILMLSGIIP